ncbi:MAG TPA: GNAT family N-acetyltransferase [Ktedonobacteraceae bacterium]|nr:GNAT family N-acetyltransferase [Ktedonobacteraceae bacterium]
MIDPQALLETPRLVLEPIQITHARALYESLQAASIYDYIPGTPPGSVEALATRYQRLSSRKSLDEQETWLNWVMCERREDRYVGTVQATVYPDATALLAYMVFPAFWRRGYAREGCERILDLLFEDYQVHTVSAEIDTRNLASIHLIESLGFQRVAITLNADFFKGATSHEYRYERRSHCIRQHETI